MVNKMRMAIMQTLREQVLRAKATVQAYPEKQCIGELSSVQTICRRIDSTGFAENRRPGSGRPECSYGREYRTETLKTIH